MIFRKTCRAGARTGFLTLLLWICLSSFLPAAALASENEAGGWGVWETVGKFFNLGVVLATLIYVLRKPLGQFFEERRLNIRRSLEEALQAKIRAETKLAEMEKRMAGLDEELKLVREKAEQDAEEAKKQAAQEAEQECERIIGLARHESESLVHAATLQLRDEAARLAVELAEKKIQSEMGGDMDNRLVEQFVQQLGKSR